MICATYSTYPLCNYATYICSTYRITSTTCVCIPSNELLGLLQGLNNLGKQRYNNISIQIPGTTKKKQGLVRQKLHTMR